jgi:hypothetical protein
LCEIESALANSNISEAQRILAEAKGAIGDDGKTEYTFVCTKCNKPIPCTMILPFSVIDTKMCVDGAAEGDFKLIEQHQEVIKAVDPVPEKPEEKKEELIEEEIKEEASLPL